LIPRGIQDDAPNAKKFKYAAKCYYCSVTNRNIDITGVCYAFTIILTHAHGIYIYENFGITELYNANSHDIVK
jgi:hypothetical protein